MSGLDRRHRWGEPERGVASLVYTCRACGRKEIIEILIREDVADALSAFVHQPNPYRTLGVLP